MKSRKSGRSHRMVQRQRTRISFRQIAVISSSMIAVLTVGCFMYFNFSNVEESHAAVAGDYRSKTTGNWNSTSTWERFSGTNWVAATATPNSSNGEITIRNNHTVTVTADVTVDQLIIASGGTVTVNSSRTITLANSTGTDASITGTLKSSGNITLSSGADISFENGGKYQHNFSTTAGTIPTATWNTGSTCEVIGYTTNTATPAGLASSFYNFTWNCPLQLGTITLLGNPTTVNGNFTIAGTGLGSLRWSDAGATMSVGNFIFSSGYFTLSTLHNDSSFLNIAGNYTQSGGVFTIVTGNASNAFINLSGNLTHSGGTITVDGNTISDGYFNFIKNGTQTFTASLTAIVSGRVNYDVRDNSIVNPGGSLFTGGGTFEVSDGGTLMIDNILGISSTGPTGQVLVTRTRTFSTQGNYIYCGTLPQITGTGLPSTVNDLTINNSSNVTLTDDVAVSNIFTLTSGKLVTGANEVSLLSTSVSSITGYSDSKYVIGNLRRSISSTGTYDFPVGNSSYYELITVTFSSVTGFNSVKANFNSTNPLTALFPLSGIFVAGFPIQEMLDHGYWTLTPNAAMTGGLYGVTLNSKGASNNDGSAIDYCVLKRANSSSPWQSLGTHDPSLQSITNGIVKSVRTELTSFSDFAAGKKSAGALPIELKFFKAKLKNGKVDLDWATASEVNNNFFSIERSSNGKDFILLSTQPGAGNSTQALYYHDEDANPLQGYSFYRLKQTDYDGKFTYSNVESIKNNDKNASDEDIFEITSVGPNPFSDYFDLAFRMEQQVKVELRLYNSTGQMVFQDFVDSNDGITQYHFEDQKSLMKGVYYLNLVYLDKKVVQKLIKN
jgi:hypothetical protein